MLRGSWRSGSCVLVPFSGFPNQRTGSAGADLRFGVVRISGGTSRSVGELGGRGRRADPRVLYLFGVFMTSGNVRG